MKLLKITLLSIALLVFSACTHGHDHDNHDHKEKSIQTPIQEVELEPEVVTHFSDAMELFVEFDPLILKQPSTFLAHFTDLKNFKPILKGRVEVCLNYNEGVKECFEIDAPARAGLFKPVVHPSQSGKAKLVLNLYTKDGESVHDLGEYDIVSSKDMLEQTVEDEAAKGITFLKEQQWEIDFATKAVATTKLRSSLLSFGRFEFPRSSHQILTAPVSGIVTPAPNINVGTQVKVGEVIAYITPSLGEKEDTATLGFELQRSNANLSLAKSQYSRLEKLKTLNAVSNKRLLEAKNALFIAKAQVTKIQKRLRQINPKAQTKSGVALRSRIDGMVVSQVIFSGSYVETGEKLITLADTNTLWLNIQLSQDDIAKVKDPSGVTLYRADKELTISAKDMKMLYLSQLIDPKSATASLLYEVDNREFGFKSGERFSLRLYTQDATDYITIAKSAVVDDNGVKVVFVLLDGEHYERRNVELGIIDGLNIAVTNGLKVGERVVTIGAYRVLLSSLSPAAAGAGHAH